MTFLLVLSGCSTVSKQATQQEHYAFALTDGYAEDISDSSIVEPKLIVSIDSILFDQFVDPKYPDLALRAGLEGTVTLKVYVRSNGTVKKAFVEKSDAVILNRSALVATMQSIFAPVLVDNRPVEFVVVFPHCFFLSAKDSVRCPKYRIDNDKQIIRVVR